MLTAGVALDKATLAMALLGLFGLILFLLGKYSSGLARLQKQKFLRPSAAYLLLSAYAGFTATATIAAVLREDDVESLWKGQPIRLWVTDGPDNTGKTVFALNIIPE